MNRLLFAAAAAGLLLAAPAGAQDAAVPPADAKISQVIVYGDDKCPDSSGDTIVVCARKPEGERYRIPEALRGNPHEAPSQSWAAKATELQYVGRTGIGSCSTVGPGGFIGCYNELVRKARDERRAGDTVNWEALIAAARQERLSKIDEQSEAEEAEASEPR
jgi:hypothetical protein